MCFQLSPNDLITLQINKEEPVEVDISKPELQRILASNNLIVTEETAPSKSDPGDANKISVLSYFILVKYLLSTIQDHDRNRKMLSTKHSELCTAGFLSFKFHSFIEFLNNNH